MAFDGFDSKFDTSWLDAYSAPSYSGSDYDAYSGWTPPTPAIDYSSDIAPTPYVPPTWMSEPSAPAEQPWYQTAATGLVDYAKANPKDVLGMGLGGAMGLAGFFMQPDSTPGPDLRGVRSAQSQMQQQLQSTQGLNADAIAKLRAQMGGDYGDYSDAASARQAATAQLQQLMANGPDYTLQPEEERAVAELAQKWQGKGMMGSSLHNQELQALRDSFRTNALSRYQSQLKALQDVTSTFSGQTSREFSNTGGVVNQGQSQQLAGLGQLAESGLRGAALESQVDQGNTKLEADRASQLMKVGGDIFGRSMADPAGDLLKAQTAFRKHTGDTV